MKTLSSILSFELDSLLSETSLSFWTSTCTPCKSELSSYSISVLSVHFFTDTDTTSALVFIFIISTCCADMVWQLEPIHICTRFYVAYNCM